MQFRRELAFALFFVVAGCEDCSKEEELLHFGMLQVENSHKS